MAQSGRPRGTQADAAHQVVVRQATRAGVEDQHHGVGAGGGLGRRF